MKVCSNCKFEFDSKYSFCPKCGSRLVDNISNIKEEHIKNENEPLTVPIDNSSEKTGCDFNKKTITVALAILIIVFFTIFSYGSSNQDFKFKLYDIGILEPSTAEEQYDYAYKLANEDKNYKEAFKWYKISAESGNPSAQNNLGVLYASGNGVDKDDKEAFKWFLKSAEQGNDVAQCNVANNYLNGTGIIKNREEAKIWLKKSADNHNTKAQAQYGFELWLDRDYINAAKYLKLASDSNNSFAQRMLGEFYLWGYGDIKKDHKKAFELYKKSADQNDVIGLREVAKCYECGYGVEENQIEASKYYNEAAEKGDKYAMRLLAFRYLDGKGVDRDYNKAREWLKKCGEENPDRLIQGHEQLKNLNFGSN